MTKTIRVTLFSVCCCALVSVVVLLVIGTCDVSRQEPMSKPVEPIVVQEVSELGSGELTRKAALSAACAVVRWPVEDLRRDVPQVDWADPILVGDISNDGSNEILLVMSAFSSDAEIMVVRRRSEGQFIVISRHLSRRNFSVGIETNIQNEVLIVATRAGEYTIDADTIRQRLKKKRYVERTTLRFHGGDLDIVDPWTITQEKVVWVSADGVVTEVLDEGPENSSE